MSFAVKAWVASIPGMRLFLAAILRWPARLSGRKLALILCYHEVAPVGGDPRRDLVPAVEERAFVRQLAHLKHAYDVVPLERVRSACAGRRRGQRFPVAITFDDDLISHVRHAMPALTASGLPATFFVCGASLRSPFSFWWEDLQRLVNAGYEVEDLGGATIHEVAARVERMPPAEHDAIVRQIRAKAPASGADIGIRAEDLARLVAEGFEIGFHTRGHYLLTTLDDVQLGHELSHGREEVAEVVQAPVVAVAYPHGKADRRVARAARSAGFQLGLTTSGEPLVPESDPHLIGRLDVSTRSVSRLALGMTRALRVQPGLFEATGA